MMQPNDSNRKMHENHLRAILNNMRANQSRYQSVNRLWFAGTNLHIGEFQNWLDLLKMHCLKRGVQIVSQSGAKRKNIERAFYKAFYVYGMQSNEGFKQMTDVLRCSFVFASFKDLYMCFSVIERLTTDFGGILRCKDRFDPKHIAFGYRDLLINIYCPGSKIVCEIQLHHQMFYLHKQKSHELYKKVRLFEQDGVNLAYNYADKHNRKYVGDRVYGMSDDLMLDAAEDKEENEVLSKVDKLLNEWNLSQYKETLVGDGYDDVEYWKDLTMDDLTNMKFKRGHAVRFMDKVKQN